MRVLRLLLFVLLCLLLQQCETNKKKIPKAKKGSLSTPLVTKTKVEKQRLSEYHFFQGNLADLKPSKNVFPYTLNTPLFSNYAFKKRFIYLPEGKQMSYNENEVFTFQEGAVLIKNFYYPSDFRDQEGTKKIIETRLLIKEKLGWKALNYLWDENQKDAHINYVGKKTTVSWIHADGKKKSTIYNVPNNNQCKNCHLNGKNITPIGPTAAQLNRKYKALSNQLTQLEFFNENSILNNFPQHEEISKFAVWNKKESGTLSERTKAYLDINCAHCHNPQGSAKNSGLDLRFSQSDLRKQGIFKPPIAAGKGSGDLQYSIVPGHPEQSILVYRMKSDDPGIMMPEIGRSIVHQEGVALITAYIKNLTIDSQN
ncbi:MAG: SO2930 family diheme c-type cytochrome [Flavobacteriaceae bacterium]